MPSGLENYIVSVISDELVTKKKFPPHLVNGCTT